MRRDSWRVMRAAHLLEAEIELAEAQVKERAWAEGREATAVELDAAAELGADRAKEKAARE